MNLTLVITTYNSASYIANLLDSLYTQNFSGGILIMDDCSTDETIPIIKNWELKNQQNFNIKIVRNESNCGLAENRNKSISFIATEFFMFLDVDDFIDVSVLNKMECHFSSDEILVTKSIMIQSNKIKNLTCLSNNKKMYFAKSSWCIWGIVFPVKIFDKNYFLKGFDIGEDINSFSLVAKNKLRMIKSYRPLYFHIFRANSMSNKGWENLERKNFFLNSLLRNMQNVLENISDPKELDIVLSRFMKIVYERCLAIQNDLDIYYSFVKNYLNNKDLEIVRKTNEILILGKKRLIYRYWLIVRNQYLRAIFLAKFEEPLFKKNILVYIKKRKNVFKAYIG